MSYVKLPKTTSDHAIGFQSVVQAVDNNAALVTAFDAAHSIGIDGDSQYGFPLRAVGRHDDILIARTVADFTVASSTLGLSVGGPLFGSRLNYSRLGTGQWMIYLATNQLFGAVALMKSTASSDYKANCYASYSPSTGPAVTVSTWNIATPALEDLPFSLVLWTQVA